MDTDGGNTLRPRFDARSADSANAAQTDAEYAKKRKWKITKAIQEIGSGAEARPKRDELLKLARRRKLDAVLVWRLDRCERSVADLVGILRELSDLGVGLISLTEVLDLTTPAGKAMAGMIALFAEFERDILRERVGAGIAHAGENGRPPTAKNQASAIKKLKEEVRNHSAIARELKIGRSSVMRLLKASDSDLKSNP